MEVEGEEPKIYRVSAVGKYPYVLMNQGEIVFDDVSVNKITSRDLILKNSSEVPAYFSIQNEEGKHDFDDNFYVVEPNQGVIPPKMNYQIKVNYQPKFIQKSRVLS